MTKGKQPKQCVKVPKILISEIKEVYYLIQP